AVQTFTVTVNAVNDAPIVTLGAIPAIDEDAGMQMVPNFATFSPGGGPDEAGQTAVEYIVSEVSNPAAFATGPLVSAAGVLFYMPVHDASGVITFRVRVRDNGGTANGGQDLSLPATATLTINGVNDPPVAIAHDVTIDARGGCVSLGVTPGQL